MIGDRFLVILEHHYRVDHNITVGAGLPRPYNVARVQLKTAVNKAIALF